MRFLKLFSSPFMFIALLGLFFFPFLEVQCDREVWIEATGIQLISDHATFHEIKDHTELNSSSNHTQDTRKHCHKRKKKRKHCTGEAPKSCQSRFTDSYVPLTCDQQPQRRAHCHREHQGHIKHTIETVPAKTHLDHGLGAQGYMGLAFLCGLIGLIVSFWHTRQGAFLRGIVSTLGLGTMGYFWSTYQGFWNKENSTEIEFVVEYQPAFFLVMGLFLVLAVQAFWAWKHWPAPAAQGDQDAWDRYTDDTDKEA